LTRGLEKFNIAVSLLASMHTAGPCPIHEERGVPDARFLTSNLFWGEPMLMTSLIVFNIIIVIIAIFFAIALWKGANTKRATAAKDKRVENSISKESLNSS
jgi:uncharacterized membrane protein